MLLRKIRLHRTARRIRPQTPATQAKEGTGGASIAAAKDARAMHNGGDADGLVNEDGNAIHGDVTTGDVTNGDGGGIEETEIVQVDDIIPGDVVLLREGEMSPVDGTVAAPPCAARVASAATASPRASPQRRAAVTNTNAVPAVDASSVSGEFKKQKCYPGDAVYSGSTVLPGPSLRLRASKPAKSSVLALLTQELADRCHTTLPETQRDPN